MTSRIPPSESTLIAALRPEWAQNVLAESLPLDWSRVGQPADVRIERYWPSGDEGLSVEWSFGLDDGCRYHVYATMGLATVVSADAAAVAPRLEHGSLRGVSVRFLDGRGRLHSPDCDTRLTQLPNCLSADVMAGRLKQLSADATRGDGTPPVSLRCQLMGYRAGRRAVVRYSVDPQGDAAVDIVGKMFHDDRGSRLVDLHTQLNEEFAKQGATWLHVPEPVGYDAELRMAWFSWAPTVSVESSNVDRVTQATRALAWIHKTSSDGLPEFAVENERAIVRRWLKLMTLLDGVRHQSLAALAGKIDAMAEAVDEAELCTIHRDYYPSQVVFHGDDVTVLDIDTLATGSRCVDLGNYLAHLFLSELDRGGSMAGWAGVADECLRHYESFGAAVSRSELAYYLSTSLFRVGAVHFYRTASGHCAESLWRVADELVSLGTFDPCSWSDTKRSCSKVSTC